MNYERQGKFPVNCLLVVILHDLLAKNLLHTHQILWTHCILWFQHLRTPLKILWSNINTISEILPFFFGL